MLLNILDSRSHSVKRDVKNEMQPWRFSSNLHYSVIRRQRGQFDCYYITCVHQIFVVFPGWKQEIWRAPRHSSEGDSHSWRAEMSRNVGHLAAVTFTLTQTMISPRRPKFRWLPLYHLISSLSDIISYAKMREDIGPHSVKFLWVSEKVNVLGECGI